MKYLWLNQNGATDTINMQSAGDYIGREYNIKVMDQQHDTPKKVKRFRSAFTTDQVNYLERQFKKFPYIGNAHRKEVSTALNIPERAVKIWFQNRRMKEKKESTNKEFDDEQGIRKSLEFAKDQLNNVSAPSTNELRSLPLLTDTSQMASHKNMFTNNTTCNIRVVQEKETKDTGPNVPPATHNVVTTAKIIHPPSVFVKTSPSPQNFKTSADFSIDYKKYKMETLPNTPTVDHSFKKETEDIKKSAELKPTASVEQMMPEDLSPNRKMNMPTMVQQQNISGNGSNPGYVSLVPTVSPFYTQPYITASGVIWKPMSVMPVVTPNQPSISAPRNPVLNMTTVEDNVMKSGCNCNCHVKQGMPQVPYNFQQPSQSPQYIITAVPYQNPSPKY